MFKTILSNPQCLHPDCSKDSGRAQAHRATTAHAHPTQNWGSEAAAIHREESQGWAASELSPRPGLDSGTQVMGARWEVIGACWGVMGACREVIGACQE